MLAQDAIFYPVKIQCKNREKVFYMAKITRCEDIIDYEKSGYRTFFDGSKVAASPIVCKNVEKDFYLAKVAHGKDVMAGVCWVATERLKHLVEEHKMKIEFVKV